jgi:hypothetical protein
MKFFIKMYNKLFDVKRKPNPYQGVVDLKALRDVSQLLHKTKVLNIDQFYKEFNLEGFVDNKEQLKLKNLFDKYGSDKSSTHNYHLIYQPIINALDQENINLIEIGLGTNNIRMQSNMGSKGKPLASAFAFRDFKDNINYFGGDIDRGILENHERISTSYVDQMDNSTLDTFFEQHFNIAIDDGMHILRANLNFFVAALNKAKNNSYIIVEDINPKDSDFWCTISENLNIENISACVQTKSAIVFCLKKI